MKPYRLLGATALAGVALMPFASFAQSAGTTQSTLPVDCVVGDTRPQCDPEADETDRGATIIVTGSRIRNPNLTSPEPITTFSSAQLRERNFTNVADALNELPGIRGSVTPAGGQGFGQGTNFINILGLGSNRTLTLYNGRRFVSSNVATIFANAGAGTQVDTNIIPSILVDSISQLNIGGAPIYGSDAISGTIDITLRSRFKGLEVSATSGISEQGDNQNLNFSGIAGRDFLDGRLNITVAASHDDLKGMVYNDREFLRRRIGGATNPSAAQSTSLRPGGIGAGGDGRLNPGYGFNNSQTDGNPGTVLIRNVNIPFLTAGGLITATNLAGTDARNPAVPFGVATSNGLQFASDGNLVPFNQGILFPGTSGSGGDGFRFADYTQITSDLRRTTLNGFITFKATDEIELFAEGTYFKSRADELTQQPTFNSSLFGGLSGPVNYSVNNPFLNDQARAQLASRGVTTFQVSRASDDLADLTGYNETDVIYGVLGARSEFRFLGGDFDAELYGSYGRTRSNDYGQDLNAQRFINATNVARDAAGNIVCTTAPTRTGGNGFAAPGGTPIADAACAPLNLFGRGAASDAARAYVVEQFVTRSEQEQQVFNSSLSGTTGDIYGSGGIGLNIGYEYRREQASFTPSSFQQEGRGRSVPITALSGEYELNDIFGEIVLPLISPDLDLSFIEQLQLTGRGRYSHNSINGGFFAYTGGVNFAPVTDVMFRGTYTRSFRSPGITELFLPQVNTFATVPDLCQPASRNGGPAPAVRAANCAAFIAAFPGTDFNTPDSASLATVPARSGGNPNLDNEEARSFSYGVVLQPRFLPRFSVTVDYTNISLRGPIANLTIAQIASGCFDNSSFDTSDVLNANSFCSQIARDPATGRVINNPATPAATSGFVNGQRLEVSGIQSSLNYALPMSGAGLDGTLTFAADLQYIDRRLNDITGVAATNSQGVIGDPQISGQFRVRYVERNFGLNTTVNFVGQQLFSRLNRVQGVAGSGTDARELDKLDPYAVVNLGVFFDPADNFRFTMAVNNLFNRQGQDYYGELHPSSFNDLIGRRFNASVRASF